LKKRRIADNYIKLRQLDLFYHLLNMEGEAQTFNVNAVCRASLRVGNEADMSKWLNGNELEQAANSNPKSSPPCLRRNITP